MKRPFQPLSHNQGPRGRYDVVVIGAGIGGLIAANLLAKQGLQVLLVEQHYMVGGFCSTFRRRGFTFDAASHFYPLLGNPTTMSSRLLSDIGARTQWIKMDPVDQFHLPDDMSFAVPANFDKYLSRLKQEFPDEAEPLDRFFRLARKLYLWGVLHFFRELETRRLDRYLSMTVRDALDQFFRSPRLKLLLTADCPHWGSPPNRTSFVFDSMLRLSYFEGNYYPRGGSQAFADELARRFQEQGGDILLKSSAGKIVVRNNTVQAVDVEIGPQRSRRQVRIEVQAVVSNADMRLTLERLLEPGIIDNAYLNRIRGLRPSFSCFLLHLGVTGIPREVLSQAHGYYWRDWDSDRVASGAFDFKLFVPTLYEPNMAPPGGHVVVVQKVTDVDYDAVEDWQAHKAEIEDFVLTEIERRIPGFRDRIQVCLSASAATSHRFTLNHQGAMLGWEMSPDQLGQNRPAIASPVNNLYFVGQWTRPGGGITPVIVSAMRVAELLGKASSATIENTAPVQLGDDPIPARLGGE